MLSILNCYSPNFQGFILMKNAVNNQVGMLGDMFLWLVANLKQGVIYFIKQALPPNKSAGSVPGKTVSTGSGWTITNLSADSWSGLLKWCRTFVDLFLQNVLLCEMKFAKLRKRPKQTLHSQMILHSFNSTSTACKKKQSYVFKKQAQIQSYCPRS